MTGRAPAAGATGRGLSLPAKSVSAEEAVGHFGMPLAIFAQLDVPASGKLTREQFTWGPTGPGLIADIDLGHYVTETPSLGSAAAR